MKVVLLFRLCFGWVSFMHLCESGDSGNWIIVSFQWYNDVPHDVLCETHFGAFLERSHRDVDTNYSFCQSDSLPLVLSCCFTSSIYQSESHFGTTKGEGGKVSMRMKVDESKVVECISGLPNHHPIRPSFSQRELRLCACFPYLSYVSRIFISYRRSFLLRR